MLFIATHKDFIYTKHYKDVIIVDGNECKKDYKIPVKHENDFPSHYTKLHDSYAEISRLYYIYKCLRPLWGSYVGFMQYKRIFDVKEEDIPRILNDYECILPKAVSQSPTIVEAYKRYHCIDDILLAINIIKEKFPEYKVDDVMYMKTGHLHPHNSFIMKSAMFDKYCQFLFTVFMEFDKRMKWNELSDWKESGRQNKTHGFLAERLSNLFYLQHFKHPYVVPLF